MAWAELLQLLTAFPAEHKNPLQNFPDAVKMVGSVISWGKWKWI